MTTREKEFSVILENLADSLDIPETYFKKAESRYIAMGSWLEREESSVADKKPSIYPQGSFLLGTMVKPINDTDEYDIDLVCELGGFSKQTISQKNLKEIVGDEIKGYARANSMNVPVEEKQRCWTLKYADDAKFHMDILPAIPDDGLFKVALREIKIPVDRIETAIVITDNTDKNQSNYNQISLNWLRSNPKGYAAWFKEKMRRQFEIQQKKYAESTQAKVEEIPEYKIKTTLQRSVQLLKRHRDIMFANDQDDKPISIIITTLAAHAYNNEEDLFDAVISIINGMPSYIESRGRELWVSNPVNPSENFAEKWEKHPERAQKFFQWLKKVNEDFNTAIKEEGIDSISKMLELCFGEKTTKNAIVRMGEDYAKLRNSGALKMSLGTGLLGKTGEKTVKKHTFYGK